MFLGLMVVGLLAQAGAGANPGGAAQTPKPAQAASPAQPAPVAPATPLTEAERAAQAAQKAAEAAERAAVAAEKAAESIGKLATTTPAPAAPTAAPATKDTGWTGTAGLALIWLTGNASTLTFNATGSAARQWSGWALAFKAFGTYGLSRPPDPGAPEQVTALAAGGQLRGDKKAGELLSFYLQGGLGTDHVKSVELTWAGEGGVGLTWVNTKEGDLQKVLLRTDLALHYQHDNRFQYYPVALNLPDVNLLGPHAALAFRYAANKDVIFGEDVDVTPSIIGTPSGRVLASSTTKVNARLTSAASLSVAFAVGYDSQPAPGKVDTDTALTVGVEFAL